MKLACYLSCWILLRSSFYHPQVTTGCDLVPIFKGSFGASRLAAGRSLSLIFKIVRGEEARSPITRQVSALDGRLRFPRRYCGPRLWTPSAPRDSRLGGVRPSALKLRGARRQWSPIEHHVSLRDLTAFTSPDDVVGPGPRFSRHFVSCGSQHQYFGTSRGEISRLRATCIPLADSAMAPTASICRDIASRNLAIPAPKFSSLFLRGPDTRSYVRIQRFSLIQIQRLCTFSLLASSRLEYPILGSLPCELPSPRVQEITRCLNRLRSTALVTSRVPPEGFRPLISLKL
jgi:hypothetical protein